MTEPATIPSAPTASRWEDFIDIFTSPSAVFRRRENSGFGMPLLVFTLLFGILIYGTKPLVQPAIGISAATVMLNAMTINAP